MTTPTLTPPQTPAALLRRAVLALSREPAQSPAAGAVFDALESLDLDALSGLARGTSAVSTGATEALREYLAALPGVGHAHGAGKEIPAVAREVHMQAAMELLGGHAGNAEALGDGQSVLVASALAVSPSDAELRGAH